MRPGVIGLVLASVALAAGSQIALKLGMSSQTVHDAIQSGDSMRIGLAITTSPQVIGGLVGFGFGTVLWLFVLSQLPLSSAYPFVALGILVTVLAGRFLLGEPVSLMKFVGVGLIIVGIFSIAAGA